MLKEQRSCPCVLPWEGQRADTGRQRALREREEQSGRENGSGVRKEVGECLCLYLTWLAALSCVHAESATS